MQLQFQIFPELFYLCSYSFFLPELILHKYSVEGYTLPREDQNSRVYPTVPGQTTIGPVLRVHIIRYLDIGGIEIQIPSTTTKDWTSWVVICRGKNRYMEVLHLYDPNHNPTSSELLEHRIGKICCKRKRTWFEKDGAITAFQNSHDQFLWNVLPFLRRWNPIFLQVCSWEFRTISFHLLGSRNDQDPRENLFA